MSTACTCPSCLGGFVNGAGADLAQTCHARGHTDSHLVNGPASEMRQTPGHNITSADFVSPQLQSFPKRPTIDSIVGAGVLGADHAAPHLPGRQPPAGWGGENDATSPHASFGSLF